MIEQIPDTQSLCFKSFLNTKLSCAILATMIDDEPYFLAEDILKTLDYGWANDPLSWYADDCDFLMFQNNYLINLRTLFTLVIYSDVEIANDFVKWITKDVLAALYNLG